MGQEPDKQPEPKLETSSGGSDRPRRPTAVGQGGGGGSEGDESDPMISWPMPGLTFFRVDGIRGRNKAQARQSIAEEVNLSESRQRKYCMEDALVELHRQKVSVAFFVHGNKAAVNFYLGLSDASFGETPGTSTHSRLEPDNLLKELLHKVYEVPEICDRPFSHEAIRSMLTPLAHHIGVVTGMPAIKASSSHRAATQSEPAQIERLTASLQGHDFGILTLALPIADSVILSEQASILDQIECAGKNVDAKTLFKTKVDRYLVSQENYLGDIQLGTAVGMWQVGVYFFARDRSVFMLLKSTIGATYVDQTSHSIPLRANEQKGLQSHLERFGLLKNQFSQEKFQRLLAYRFLTPLSSHRLAAFVHLPAHDGPGFRVLR